MLTTLKLRRLWMAGRYRALIRELTAGRPEGRLGLDELAGGPIVAAALGLIRLGELSQTRSPLAGELAARLAWGQRGDGSWGEAGDDADRIAIKTALAARALADRDAAAADRAAAFLARTQGEAGWGVRSLTSAIVLMQIARLGLGDVRLGDALRAEPSSRAGVEPDAATRWAWKHARLRVGPVTPPRPLPLPKTAAAEQQLAFAA